jgi:hypothetical protein
MRNRVLDGKALRILLEGTDCQCVTRTDYVNDLNNLKTEVKYVRDPVQKVVGTPSFRPERTKHHEMLRRSVD